MRLTCKDHLIAELMMPSTSNGSTAAYKLRGDWLYLCNSYAGRAAGNITI